MVHLTLQQLGSFINRPAGLRLCDYMFSDSTFFAKSCVKKRDQGLLKHFPGVSEDHKNKCLAPSLTLSTSIGPKLCTLLNHKVNILSHQPDNLLVSDSYRLRNLQGVYNQSIRLH